MRLRSWVIPFLMLLAAGCSASSLSPTNGQPAKTPSLSTSPTYASLPRLDTTGAASFLNYCRSLNAGVPWNVSELTQMVTTTGYQTLIAHHRRMDPAISTGALVKMLAAIQDGTQFTTESARLDRIYRSYRAACNQTAVLVSRLERWAHSDIIERAVAQARLVLPSQARLQATVYLLPDGYSHAYVVEEHEAIVLDFLHPSLMDSGRFLAHELHHIGVRSLLPPPCQEAGWREALEVLTSMVQEGAASYWINGWRASPSPTDMERVEAFIRDALSDRLNADETAQRREQLVRGRYGPVYQMGNIMIATLEQEYGRDWVVSRLSDPVGLMLVWQDLAPPELKFNPGIFAMMQAAGEGSGCSLWLKSLQ